MSISQLTGTPWHIETLHSDDERRHKSRCINYDQGRCTYAEHCKGSSHCSEYKEDPSLKSISQQPAKYSISDKRNGSDNKKSPIFNSIEVNSRIELYDYNEGKFITVTIEKSEMNISSDNEYKISPESALAKALIGQIEGTIVFVNQYKYKVQKIK